MESVIEHVGEAAASVVEEALEEVTGASKRKWAVALVAFVLGGVVVAVVVRVLARRADVEPSLEETSSERAPAQADQPEREGATSLGRDMMRGLESSTNSMARRLSPATPAPWERPAARIRRPAWMRVRSPGG